MPLLSGVRRVTTVRAARRLVASYCGWLRYEIPPAPPVIWPDVRLYSEAMSCSSIPVKQSGVASVLVFDRTMPVQARWEPFAQSSL